MESYKILEEVANLKAHIGSSIATLFDYGVVLHAKYGGGHLKGTFPCFQPYGIELDANSEDDSTIWRDMSRKLGLSIAENLETLGLNSPVNEPSLQKFSKYISVEAFEVYALIFPNPSLKDFKIIVALQLALICVEDAFSNAQDAGTNILLLIDLYSAALAGNFTHLSQLPSLPESLRASIAALILFRQECLRSKLPESWSFVRQECLTWIQSLHTKYSMAPQKLEGLLSIRTETGAIPMLLETYWIYFGLSIPEVIRYNPAYHHYLRKHGLLAGLTADIVRLSNEERNFHNIVLFLARSTPFQEAIDTGVKLWEKIFYETKEAGRILLKLFPNHEIANSIVACSERLADLFIRFAESVEEQDSINHNSSCVPITFNSVYQNKENDLIQFLRKPVAELNESETKVKIEMDSIRKAKHSKPGMLKKVSQLESNGPEQRNKFVNGTQDFSEVRNPDPEPPQESFKRMKISNSNMLPPVATTVKHLAIIPDGNRRWARSQGISTLKCHNSGSDAIQKILIAAFEQGIHTITAWVLAANNFKRKQEELDSLLKLFRIVYDDYRKIADDWDSRICFMGKRYRLPEDILSLMKREEERTAHRTNHRVNIAVDYDGQEEIVAAMNKIQSSVTASTEPITADRVSENLWSGNQPYPFPDLIVRTGGKDAKTFRTSGFMIWQSVDTEFYFEDKYLPEVVGEDLTKWLEAYQSTEKRFGA